MEAKSSRARIHVHWKDRISKLPEPILHHILCFLDQKLAAKTCVLSKAWRYLWCTRPVIYFTEGYTVAENKEPFLSVVDRTLQGYLDRKLRLQEIGLWMSSGGDGALLLNKWIPILMQNMGVESFCLNLYPTRKKIELPSVVFESESLRNITLRGCVLKSTSTTQVRRVYFKNLQTLCLTHVHISQEILDNMLSNSNCPFIERVTLSRCTGFACVKCPDNNKQQQLPPTNLKHFIFRDDHNGDIDVSIEIGGNNIQTLTTMDISHCLFPVNHNYQQQLYFPHLTHLMLRNVKLSSGLFSCSLPFLEELSLEECTGVKEFNLTSRRTIKRLDINNPNRPFKVTVDAPSIVNFRYLGILPQSISSPPTTTSKIKLASEHSHSFNELNGLLKALSPSEIFLALDLFQIHGVTHNSIGVSKTKLHVVVEHLTIQTSNGNLYSSAADFLNTLFRLFRPCFIFMDTDSLTISSTELQEIVELLLKESKTTQCYVWQSVLEDVSLQVLHRNPSHEQQPFEYENHQSEWQPFRYTSFLEFSNKCAARKFEFRIHLKWRKY